MDLSKLSDGIPCGEAQKVEDSQNMPGASLFPLCSSYTVQGLSSLEVFDTELGYRSCSLFALPPADLCEPIHGRGQKTEPLTEEGASGTLKKRFAGGGKRCESPGFLGCSFW
jgi:hypothetical protein